MQTVTLLIAIAIAAAVGEPGTAKFLVAATLATVMGTFIMLAILFRTVRLQTERATEAARRFAAGDLTGRLRQDGPTEFAGLCAACGLLGGCTRAPESSSHIGSSSSSGMWYQWFTRCAYEARWISMPVRGN